MKRLIISAALAFGLALGSIELAMRPLAHTLWHDPLLVIGGLCLGAVCVYVALIGATWNKPSVTSPGTNGGTQ